PGAEAATGMCAGGGVRRRGVLGRTLHVPLEEREPCELGSRAADDVIASGRTLRERTRFRQRRCRTREIPALDREAPHDEQRRRWVSRLRALRDLICESESTVERGLRLREAAFAEVHPPERAERASLGGHVPKTRLRAEELVREVFGRLES